MGGLEIQWWKKEGIIIVVIVFYLIFVVLWFIEMGTNFGAEGLRSVSESCVKTMYAQFGDLQLIWFELSALKFFMLILGVQIAHFRSLA